MSQLPPSYQVHSRTSSEEYNYDNSNRQIVNPEGTFSSIVPSRISVDTKYSEESQASSTKKTSKWWKKLANKCSNSQSQLSSFQEESFEDEKERLKKEEEKRAKKELRKQKRLEFERRQRMMDIGMVTPNGTARNMAQVQMRLL